MTRKKQPLLPFGDDIKRPMTPAERKRKQRAREKVERDAATTERDSIRAKDTETLADDVAFNESLRSQPTWLQFRRKVWRLLQDECHDSYNALEVAAALSAVSNAITLTIAFAGRRCPGSPGEHISQLCDPQSDYLYGGQFPSLLPYTPDTRIACEDQRVLGWTVSDMIVEVLHAMTSTGQWTENHILDQQKQTA